LCAQGRAERHDLGLRTCAIALTLRLKAGRAEGDIVKQGWRPRFLNSQAPAAAKAPDQVPDAGVRNGICVTIVVIGREGGAFNLVNENLRNSR
jgi:hypothetical protein